MAHARKRNKTWQARWRLRSGKETSKDGFLTKKAAEAFGFQQEELEKRFKNTKTSDLKLTLLEFIEEGWKWDLIIFGGYYHFSVIASYLLFNSLFILGTIILLIKI